MIYTGITIYVQSGDIPCFIDIRLTGWLEVKNEETIFIILDYLREILKQMEAAQPFSRCYIFHSDKALAS